MVKRNTHTVVRRHRKRRVKGGGLGSWISKVGRFLGSASISTLKKTKIISALANKIAPQYGLKGKIGAAVIKQAGYGKHKGKGLMLPALGFMAASKLLGFGKGKGLRLAGSSRRCGKGLKLAGSGPSLAGSGPSLTGGRRRRKKK